MNNQDWSQTIVYSQEKIALAQQVLEQVRSGSQVEDAVRKYPLPGGDGYLGKNVLVAAYTQLVESGEWTPDPNLLAQIRMKPIRTLSGVTVVTVLTKPYPCPGKCIFCPTDVRMPKSYLPDEPGAMRGLHHKFDPFDQVHARLEALRAVGHPTDKIELLILGGTWSAYRRDYQEWFIQRCFEALNGVNSESLSEAQSINGYLGVTKVQLGAQSLDDRILEMNKRGHSVEDTRQAVALLRAAGFKIVLHWMPNLYGATLDSDREDFERLWVDLCPDELKIYPNQLLANAELYEYWQRGEFHPYTTNELIELIADIKILIPRYCRVNRVIRDIPSTNVVEGNKRTSLRQDIQLEMKKRGTRCQCVRCREVRNETVSTAELMSEDLVFHCGGFEEHFLSNNTVDDKLAGFLRLSLPGWNSPDTGLPDLEGAAIIREVHVYGQSLEVGDKRSGSAQHAGLGTSLLVEAESVARDKDFNKLAVISAVGTRQYYLERGFQRGDLYLVKDLA
jgi:elongator complex protein 3